LAARDEGAKAPVQMTITATAPISAENCRNRLVRSCRVKGVPLLLRTNAFKSSADELTSGGVDMIGHLQCNPGMSGASSTRQLANIDIPFWGQICHEDLNSMQ
jgi:hypothetical protein